MKKCSKCLFDKSLSEFHTDKRTGSPRAWCKACQRSANQAWRAKNIDKVRSKNKQYQLKHKLKMLYNMTDEEYENAIKLSAGRCAICDKRRKLFIDHCHQKKKFRGLLCSQCNTGLGMFGDNPEVMASAIKYLTS